MHALVLVGLLAAVNAAPHFHHREGLRPFSSYHDEFFQDDVFDVAKFWKQLDTEMRELDQAIQALRDNFAIRPSTAGVVNNQFQVKVHLPGFKEDEIVVKVRRGVLMVQAYQKMVDGVERNYIDMHTLPRDVNEMGVWVYKDDVLTVMFPLKTATVPKSSEETEFAVTEAFVTQAPASREEMGTRTSDDVHDADVGVGLDKETEIRTNEIPKVEATTYAVDLKDQYEFVPVHYRK